MIAHEFKSTTVVTHVNVHHVSFSMLVTFKNIYIHIIYLFGKFSFLPLFLVKFFVKFPEKLWKSYATMNCFFL